MYFVTLHTSASRVKDRAIRLSKALCYKQARAEAARYAQRFFGQSMRRWPLYHSELIPQRT